MADERQRLYDAMLENVRFLGPHEPAPTSPTPPLVESMRQGYGVLNTDRSEPPNDRVTREMLQQWQNQGLTGWRTPPMTGGTPLENPFKGSLAGNLIDYLFPPRPPRPTPWQHQPRGAPQYYFPRPDLPPPPPGREWSI